MNNFQYMVWKGFTIMYLIGELNRRSGNYDEALRYLGDVITSRMRTGR